MTTVFDTARYILEQYGPMSAMKLQRLCYYAQAWSLVWDKTPLFQEDFEAWATGPVCSELLYRIREKHPVCTEDIPGMPEPLSGGQRDTVDRVLEYYGPHDARWLGQLSCMEEPWKKARAQIPVGACCTTVVTKEDMASYYTGLTRYKEKESQEKS